MVSFKTLHERCSYRFPTRSVRVSVRFGKQAFFAFYRTVAPEVDGVVAGRTSVPTASRFKRTVNSGQARRMWIIIDTDV